MKAHSRRPKWGALNPTSLRATFELTPSVHRLNWYPKLDYGSTA
jgi:hypothetical protein